MEEAAAAEAEEVEEVEEGIFYIYIHIWNAIYIHMYIDRLFHVYIFYICIHIQNTDIYTYTRYIYIYPHSP